MVAFDDIITYPNGDRTLRSFHRDQEFGLERMRMGRQSSKRPRPEDDYTEDGGSDDSDTYHTTKKGARALERPSLRRSTRHEYESDDSDIEDDLRKHSRTAIGVPVRRSTRQTVSRQQSIDDEPDFRNDQELQGFQLSDEEDDKPKTGVGSNRRTTRPKRVAFPTYTAPGYSEDELANVNSSDDGCAFVPVISDLAPTNTRNSARKRKGRVSYSSQSRNNNNDRESSIEFEETPNRRSGRSNRNTKSMKVPDEQDEYEIIEKELSAPKHVSVKEIFQSLPDDSKFESFHSTTCDTCQGAANAGKGPFIYCQGCSYSFHRVCLGLRSSRDHRVTKVGPDSFVLQCRICIGMYQKKDENAPNHAMCQSCKKDGLSCAEFSTKKTPKQEEKLRLDNGGEDPITEVNPNLINNTQTLLFRCAACKRGFHFEHLPPLMEHDVISNDVRTERLKEYSAIDWRCKDCYGAPQKIHALVAWRPIDQEAYGNGYTCAEVPEDEKQYLVKWEGRSHFHDIWMPGGWVFGAAASAMRTSFYKRESAMLPKMDTKDAVDEEWLLPDVLLKVKYRHATNRYLTRNQDLARISDVKEVFVKFVGLSYLETVWDSPPHRGSGAPWDAFCAAYEEYVNGVHFPSISGRKMEERIQQYRDLDFATECELETQPPGLKRGKLMEYQMEGLNWLLYNFHSKHSVILADEMGLGKTVQVVAFISALVQDKPNCWPFLIVVPNSTCPNWRRELKHWAPELRVVAYHGGKGAQDLVFRNELFPDGVKDGMKAHAVIMSYEAAVDAKATFRSVKWAGLIVDEGQRLKNERSLLYLALQDMNVPFRLLLTGTPLQNNKRELFNLMQFIDENLSAEKLDEKYQDLTKDKIAELHKLIRPYFLRRTKAQVLKFLPPMAQIIIPLTMTVLQQKLSKSIMARNPDLIRAIMSKSKVKQGERKSLTNILMELRQVLCHPFLFNQDVEDRFVTDPVKVQQNLVEASGKLLLLNIMLPKLAAKGHRVLIFSQFLHSLTIIEDFLTALGLEHARIDGSMSALEKQKRIDAYNAPDSPLFAMLLSTRAGGVGINLATADTVIIYDPDFNPHQDIQALSRAHRIGQKDKVLCFQLMTKDTVEEKIMQIGRKKMALDHALIESMDAEDDIGESLESILKHGAETLFTDTSKNNIIYDEASVEKLIDRSQMESTDTGDDESAESQFSFARVWANDSGTLKANVDDEVDNSDDEKPRQIDANTWENILKHREEEHQRELALKQQEYGRGARRRGTQSVHYDRPRGQDSDRSDDDIEGDELYIDANDVESEKEDDADDDYGGAASKSNSTKAPDLDAQQPHLRPPPESKVSWLVDLSKPARPQKQQSPRPLRQTPVPPPMIPARTVAVTAAARPAQRTQPPKPNPPGTNGNFVVAIPSVPPTSAYTPTSNTGTLQRSPAVSNGTSSTNKTNNNANSQAQAPCFICQQHHAHLSCINLNSEISLRIAIDSLRTWQGSNQAIVQATRASLTKRLREVTQGKPK
ncbi:PHD/FYVE-zinc-finger like domain-containing protein [Pseudomassariella vexata]|uniref:PHD/FYVE-zinc-finger like domain-domain-containing protein n=1 Tax=Pseudomassariella vexata TaxID=1141098 RepID=A0A1Y2E3G9_9PEZI|nr:PHD/FYVE-zinc-finger like domain-containing protein [Pseudomassariella vexata]ORY65415.1 PHD/FYVE-zinc-finger like domain-domain-containing protein [Pseudomassariella vexata]